MNKYKFTHIFLCFCMGAFLMSCSKFEPKDITITKKGVFQHNYIAISTIDGSAGKVEVSYAILENGKNVQVSKALDLPALIGGENIMATYLSNARIFPNTETDIDTTFYESYIQRNYNADGSDNLFIKNLSDRPIHYCVIGNQHLHYYKSHKHKTLYLHRVNTNEIDTSRIIMQVPTPIYKFAPLLYLLKPELAPNKDSYVVWDRGRYDGNIITVHKTSGKKVPLHSNHVGEITEELPYSIEKILKIYRGEYVNEQKILFARYSNFNDFERGDPSYNIASNSHIQPLYGKIDQGQSITNSGQIWFVNTISGILTDSKIHGADSF